MYKFNITHNNLYLKNIILVSNELKISGFKPLYLEDKSRKGWKYEIAGKYGLKRFDIFLIGLLWLKFLNEDYEDKIKSDYTLI